ncbi:beta-glucoside-specific PTS transporter subunit IIABC [Tetragenococcus koreensis]|uniref:beta-glucoside-specific PTS transporter subunit IIABC n=1 Tax=Tetragenococcus koreensis TaxID=290335 RepID=UPI000F4EF2B7|nr:beta-glucoside-specific PTS transporter subunit IIABC [Tetragenococcus koreensis]AYW44846.1 PTS beta-glucoside transporter subunit EIIBCA [Tetragenococcus koreensis]MDN6664310.1 beta-glucoside-specific PTS transporter subunit IIABC [Tetragenococcus koreensis]GEN90417.1 PTS beta-glucoside transporter subunit EIIBCA [Tetragenococcus koreensis]
MSKDNYDDLARDIIDHVGGEENVAGLRHCVTRLRFNLKDENKADTDYLKNKEGVVTVMKSAGQYQVVIGEQVAEVYEAIVNQTNIGGDASASESSDGGSENDNRNVLDKFIDFISGVFQPFLMALAATGMIKGLVALLGTVGVDPESGLYQVLNFAGDGFFQFLPVMVAITAARKLKMNEFTALAIAVAFLHPEINNLMTGDVMYTLFSGTAFESPIYSTFIGIPIIMPPNGYYSAIIPILVSVWLGSVVEKWVKNIIPGVVRSFLTPFFTVMIVFVISLIVIGPIANWASTLVGQFFLVVQGFSPLLFGALLALSWQLLVIFGLHWGIVPIMFILLAEQGYETIGPVMVASTFGVLGVIIALLIKSKSKKVRDIALPGAISLVFGVSEPTIYGLMLPMKRSFLYALISNAVGGAYIGSMNVVGYRAGGLGVFSIFNTINPNGNLDMNFWNVIIGFALCTVVGFVLQMVFPVPSLEGDGNEGQTASNKNDDKGLVSSEELQESAKEDIIASPMQGQLVPITEVSDEVFSSEALGKGVAIKPEVGEVRAPANGVISTLFPTGHAVGMKTDEGTEVLIHIGLDTVELEGKYYEILVKQEQRVNAGDLLIKFDKAGIESENYDMITPIVITNSGDFKAIDVTEETEVTPGDYLLTAIK